MEEVERINKMAVESGHKMLTLMGQLKQQPQDELLCRNLISQADDSLVKFKGVVSLLGNRCSVARARRFKSLSIPNLPENLLIETLDSIKTPLQLLPKASSEADPKSKKPVPDTHAIFDDVWGSLSVKPPQILQYRPNEMQRMHFYNQQQQQMKYHAEIYNCGLNLKFDGSSNTMSSNRSFMSALSMDVSVANSFQVTGLPKPSGQTSEQLMRRRCTFKGEDGSLKCVSNGKCHCSKRRKVRMKRSIKVPAISNKIADIPPDEYSWRKYGQKPIKGSPYPRGYYKCSSMRGCPARKHVERCVDEPAMLVVTYEGDHNHSRLT